MLEQNQIKEIKKAVEEFLEKMTVTVSGIEANLSPALSGSLLDIVDVSIEIDEPQILIGQGGQTLFETQRILRMILNKKLQNDFRFNLDINGYKKQKIEYLKSVAKDSADRVSVTKEEKALSPMSAYERMIVHAELAQRTDVATESRGEGFERHIVIIPR